MINYSGGNTLHATDRMISSGAYEYVKTALNNGVVGCGGSAGGIAWFDSGYIYTTLCFFRKAVFFS